MNNCSYFDDNVVVIVVVELSIIANIKINIDISNMRIGYVARLNPTRLI